MQKYSKDLVLSVVPFTSQQEESEVVIGHPPTGVFLAIPTEAFAILKRLADGMSIGETGDWFQREYGETPDLDDFLGLLEEKGFISTTPYDERPAGEQVSAAGATKLRYHFSSFPEPLAHLLFGPKAVVLYGMLICTSLACIAMQPSILPRAQDLYFPDHRTLSWTIVLIVTYATLFIHEASHLVAARSLGVNSRLGIGHRLWFLVAETDLTGLWAVPKNKRYLPLVAGMLIDAVSGAFFLMVLFAHAQGWFALSVLVSRIIRAILFMYLMRIVWQCLFYIRTDLYYVIVTVWNCRNLMADTEALLRNQVAKFLPVFKNVDQSAIPASERRIIRLYAVVWIVGRIIAVVLLFTVTVPIGLRYLQNLRGALRLGYAANADNFIDSLLLTAYFFVPLTAGTTLWIKSLLRKPKELM
jgi:putative peptide zinc metalloprotease protein